MTSRSPTKEEVTKALEVLAYTKKLVDRTGWAKGPWDDEPDFEWFWTRVGYIGVIRRVPSGNLCGYVAQVEGDPAFEVTMHDEPGLEVHGGVTLAGEHEELLEPLGKVFSTTKFRFIGFDCGHWNDIAPGLEAMLKRSSSASHRGATYKDWVYVREEVESLAAQIKALK